MTYLFQLGHTPALAIPELIHVLSGHLKKFSKTNISPHILIIDTKIPLDLPSLIKRLGGTIRIAVLKHSVTDQSFLIPAITSILQEKKSSQITFALSGINLDLDHCINRKLKLALVNQGLTARFITNSTPFTPPIKILSHHLQEIIIHPTFSVYQIFLTQVVTDVFDWQLRDRLRPAVDAKSGVLPPKVARMMINLALDPAANNTTLLDPFCGSGTILTEALLLDCQVTGLDINPQALNMARQNIDWCQRHYQNSNSSTLLRGDITNFSFSPNQSFTAIVSEGYLGPVHTSINQLPKVIEQLSSLYHQALPRLCRLLSPTGKLVIALPLHSHPQSVKMNKNLIDTCEKSGYTLLHRPIVYGHSGALVKRNICVFHKTK